MIIVNSVIELLGHYSCVPFHLWSTGAVTTWQEVNGIQSKLSRYNNTIVGLRNIVTWWNGLGEIEQSGLENISFLITESEALITGELNAWLTLSAPMTLAEAPESSKDGNTSSTPNQPT